MKRLSTYVRINIASHFPRHRGATRAQRKLATFAMDGTVRFASAADRAAFTAELMQAVTLLVAKYHDEQAEGGREHHLVIAIHPTVTAAMAAQSEES